VKNIFYRATRASRLLGLLAFATVFILGENLFVAPPSTEAAGQPRVTICHRTRSTTNPYRLITVSRNALNGHLNHTGGVHPVAGWGDIIPGTVADRADLSGDAFWSNGNASVAGLNWDVSGKSFMVVGGANVSKCPRMTARRFYEISRLAGQTDAEIAADLNEQAANEDAAIRPAGGFNGTNIAGSVGGVSVTTNSPSAIGPNSATLIGVISSAGGTATTPKFEYGTSPTLETLIGTVSGGATSSSSTIDATASLSGLNTGTLYYYRVIGEIGSDETLGT
jgi:hypothetical protein